jgi:hypothetical protein
VLSIPPAFILSQDQTLRFELESFLALEIADFNLSLVILFTDAG